MDKADKKDKGVRRGYLAASTVESAVYDSMGSYLLICCLRYLLSQTHSLLI